MRSFSDLAVFLAGRSCFSAWVISLRLLIGGPAMSLFGAAKSEPGLGVGRGVVIPASLGGSKVICTA